MLKIEQQNNSNSGKFLPVYDGENAGVMQYEWINDSTFNISHTEVDKKFSGKGIGKSLVDEAVKFARNDNKKIAATCSFAKSILEKDDSVKDIYLQD